MRTKRKPYWSMTPREKYKADAEGEYTMGVAAILVMIVGTLALKLLE